MKTVFIRCMICTEFVMRSNEPVYRCVMSSVDLEGQKLKKRILVISVILM